MMIGHFRNREKIDGELKKPKIKVLFLLFNSHLEISQQLSKQLEDKLNKKE